MTNPEKITLDAALQLLQNLASDEWDRFSYTYDDWMGRRAMFYAELADFANDARLRLRRMIDEERNVTRGRYVAPRPAQPPVELTEKQQQARAAYTQLGVALDALRVAHDQLAASDRPVLHERLAEYLPVTMLEHIRIIGENLANIMQDMDFLHGTMVTQGRETLPKLRDKP